MALLEVNGVSVTYGNLTVVDRACFSLEEGQWLMIAGPNGAGKSTILSAISGIAPYEGRILYQGREIDTWKPAELARQLGVLSQQHHLEYSFRVREVVSLGRYAHRRGYFAPSDPEGEAQLARALELTGMTELADKSVLELSGGEIQRMFLAQLFAQNPRVLILDEPTNHLDLIYQKQVFALIDDWRQETGRAVISVVHDLSLAKAYGTHALLLHQGKTLACGDCEQVLSPEKLKEAYQMDVYAWMRSLLGQWQN